MHPTVSQSRPTDRQIGVRRSDAARLQAVYQFFVCMEHGLPKLIAQHRRPEQPQLHYNGAELQGHHNSARQIR
jgi:hypothetical protein